MSTPNVCPRCGRDLDALVMYSDYVHYIPATTVPCLPELVSPQDKLLLP